MKLFAIKCLLFLVPFFFSCSLIQAQSPKVTVSGVVKDQQTKSALPFVTVALQTEKGGAPVAGTITNEEGRFTLTDMVSGSYILNFSYVGYQVKTQPVLVGKLSAFLDVGAVELAADARLLREVVVTGQPDAVSARLDKKTFAVADNMSQGGGSVLQAMKNLPGITTTQEGTVQLRGSDKVTVLIDGKQTALTGFGNQAGLDNIPASAIERIEIINNPSAKYDANGNAGIINIIYKKNQQTGFNGKAGLTTGVGALWRKRENLPNIRPQYQSNRKVNPSLALNYRQPKVNLFFQGDVLDQKVLNKNEFTERRYPDGQIINQQYQENRTQLAITAKGGADWFINANNTFTFSGLYSREGHIDRGDLPYYNQDLSERQRLWMFYEDEVNSAVSAMGSYQHKFKQPGRLLNIGYNYTFHREDEKYYITNQLPTYTGQDAFKLIADQHVSDVNVDYLKPLKHGRLETGLKFRQRYIPTNMQFFPGLNSPLDVNAAGWANYRELIPALYGNYVYETKHLELEAGLRLEYVNVDYRVTPTHNTYKSDGYQYTQPFPNVRLAYIPNDRHRFSVFYNRRVDRPDEADLRIFPKYDDPEILKTGNPTLRPQFTQTVELGYKTTGTTGYVYAALYHRRTKDILTRIYTLPPNTTLINSIAQNADKGYNSGLELVLNQDISAAFSFNLNLNGYQNVLSGFSVENTYPLRVSYRAGRRQNYSGNAKLNGIWHLPQSLDVQLTGIYLAPDIIPQGKVAARYSVDIGLKKATQKGKGELFLNASDVFNTLRLRREIQSDNFQITSTDFYETQIFRVGYTYKFGNQ